MSAKKFLLLLFTFSGILFFGISNTYASQPAISYKLYGYVRNDFYINSRVNEQGLDGLFNILPKPNELNSFGEDENAVPNAEMLSVATRLGFDFSGSQLFGAKTTAKVEFDFGGVSSNYYLIRLRQAFMQLHWERTELLIGQTWHPLFGNVFPNILSINAGNPFQPFNRSPQIRLIQNVTTNSYFTLVANYQMQYLSRGPLGSSASYMKNAILPNMFLGFETKSKHWLTGIGVETKTLKINHQKLSSASAEIHSQYVGNKFQIRAKGILGQNMSDHLMIGGYAVKGQDTKYNEDTYSNLNTLSSWINIVYGADLKFNFFAGISENLGSVSPLAPSALGKHKVYGLGYYDAQQELIQTLGRLSGGLCYHVSNFMLGIEYEYTDAKYGKINSKGFTNNPYHVNNHRATASVSYFF